jgi:hypothetical protein
MNRARLWGVVEGQIDVYRAIPSGWSDGLVNPDTGGGVAKREAVASAAAIRDRPTSAFILLSSFELIVVEILIV